MCSNRTVIMMGIGETVMFVISTRSGESASLLAVVMWARSGLERSGDTLPLVRGDRDRSRPSMSRWKSSISRRIDTVGCGAVSVTPGMLRECLLGTSTAGASSERRGVGLHEACQQHRTIDTTRRHSRLRWLGLGLLLVL